MTRVMGLLLFGAAVAACGSKAEKPKVDPKAAVGFTRALSELAGVDPTQSASLIAQGAYQTVAPSEKCFESFAAAATERARVEALLDCGMACTLDAIQGLKGKEPRTWMAHLAGACEPPHFGLETSNAAMLSAEWFLLHKIGQLAAPHIEAATGADKAALDKALAAFRLPLPLPAVATGTYDLPIVPAQGSVPIATRAYVILTASGQLRVGATPYAELGARGAVIAAPEGRALFPGNEAERGDLRALVLEAGGASAAADQGPPPDAAPPPADAAQPKGAGRPPGLHGEVKMTLRGDLGQGGDPIPLFLADSQRPAAEVIETAVELRRVLLAVSSPDDPAARALPVELEANLATAGRSPEDATIVVRHGAGLDNVKDAGGSQETVVIEVDDAATWSEAAAVAAATAERGATRIVLTSVRLAASGNRGSGGPVGHGASDQGVPATSLITEGPATSSGSLDKNVIRRVMRSRMAAFRACYERELSRNHELAGQVDLEFTIGGDGAVTKARASGLPVVADCAARQVYAIKFPAPKAGGVVNVRYPLIFKPKDE